VGGRGGVGWGEFAGADGAEARGEVRRFSGAVGYAVVVEAVLEVGFQQGFYGGCDGAGVEGGYV
jgi:hypothetical protein